MAFIRGYFYATKTAANNAVKTINQGEGIPNNGYLTQTYCEPIQCVGGWCILHDEVTSKYLLNDIEIEVNI